MTPRAHLPDGWEVPQAFRDRLGVRVGAQRAMIADGHLLLVLHEPPESGETERKSRFFWRQPDGTWSSKGLSTGAQALRKHFDQYAAMLDALDEEEERASNSDHLFAIVRSLAPLHSSARCGKGSPGIRGGPAVGGAGAHQPQDGALGAPPQHACRVSSSRSSLSARSSE